jgi:hypothetical protein
MIRPATPEEVPAIVRMTFDLAHATRQPLPLVPHMIGRVALAAINDGLALVVDRGAGPVGMLVATEGASPLSPVRLGIEHGWWCEPAARGWGLRLLGAYERWGRASGLFGLRMSTPPDLADDLTGAARVLEVRGYAPVEQAWFKRLD